MPFKFPSAYNNFPLVEVTINTSMGELKILRYLIMNLFSLQFGQNLLLQTALTASTESFMKWCILRKVKRYFCARHIISLKL